MSNFNKLIDAINSTQGAVTPKHSELLYGTIITLNPLSIKVDDIGILPEECFVLGQMCRPHTVTIPHKHEYNGVTEQTNDGGQGASPHSHEIKQQVTEDLHEGTGGYSQESVILEIHPKLTEGDRVMLFSFNNGQKFYVAERVLMS